MHLPRGVPRRLKHQTRTCKYLEIMGKTWKLISPFHLETFLIKWGMKLKHFIKRTITHFFNNGPLHQIQAVFADIIKMPSHSCEMISFEIVYRSNTSRHKTVWKWKKKNQHISVGKVHQCLRRVYLRASLKLVLSARRFPQTPWRTPTEMKRTEITDHSI